MNRTFLKKAGTFRLRYLITLAALFFFINFAVRLVLPLAFADTLPLSFSIVPGLLKGALNDFATLFFVLIFPAALILLPTDKFLQRRAGRLYCLGILFIYSTTFIFTAFSEYFFWDEFSSRFNFIAVDYLIYTTELMQNMLESYPMAWLLTAVFLLAAGVTALAWKGITRKKKAPAQAVQSLWRARLSLLGSLYAAAALIFLFFAPLAGTSNRFWNEYAKNGVYEIFSAYLHNQLDYYAFYQTMDKNQAFDLMRAEIIDADADFEPSQGANLVHMTEAKTPEQKPNVILVIMESMGTKWLGEYSPNLNRLASEGLSFSNMASTGTRTVRGIEAIMLSVPPTPGNSIVRRPDNGGLFNLGTVFQQKGYTLKFIYGGYGYFDNMNAFFSGNGYTVVDKQSFAPQNKTFATAWGQCDEDLFAESLTQADKSFAENKPFQQVLLTTSNHRPFTYPAGKVAIEPGSSRRGAVSYSDYAIGQFIAEAKKKPWFDNTVFLFVGDHPSSIAGKTALPADGYGIVCIMYGPKFFQPQEVSTLCSQIDVGPTLLASLGWEYRSQFFGTNAQERPAEEGRAWISTYQLLGFRTNDRLVVLSPNAKAEILPVAAVQEAGGAGNIRDDALTSRAVASYQCAYDLFTGKRMKEHFVASHTPKLRQAAPQVSSSSGAGHTKNAQRASGPATMRGRFLEYMLLTAGAAEKER